MTDPFDGQWGDIASVLTAPDEPAPASTLPFSASEKPRTDWITRIILGIVMAAALAVGTWSVYTLLTTLLHAPWYVAGLGCFMFDGAAFFFARLSQRYATTTDSGLAPRFAMLGMICSSSWVNWRHAQLENWGTVGGVILAAAPIIAELAFEMWHRFEHREALRRLGRVAQMLPVLGHRSWLTHPFRSRRVIDAHIQASLTEHQAVAARRVEIAGVRARSLVKLPETAVAGVVVSGSSLTSGIETYETARAETGLAKGSYGCRETSETETTAETGLCLGLSHRGETGLRETASRGPVWRETETSETETSASVSETETASPTPAETPETTNSPGAAETETETARVPQSCPGETETAPVSPIGDRNPKTEIEHLLKLMRDRKSETAVNLKDAITETGRPKATAAKRLKAARALYRAEPAA